MTTYREVAIGEVKPVGIGQMQVPISYVLSKPIWGILPVKESKEDTLTYRTYTRGSKVIIEERSLMTKSLEHHIDKALVDQILKELVDAGHADHIQL